jgi:ribosomal protein S27E
MNLLNLILKLVLYRTPAVLMIFIKGRCPRCNGNLTWDEIHGEVSCFQCSAVVRESGDSVRRVLRDSKGKLFVHHLKPIADPNEYIPWSWLR